MKKQASRKRENEDEGARRDREEKKKEKEGIGKAHILWGSIFNLPSSFLR